MMDLHVNNIADIGQWILEKKTFDKEGVLLWNTAQQDNKSDSGGDDATTRTPPTATVHAKLTHNIFAFWLSDAMRWNNLEKPAGLIVMERAAIDFASPLPELPYPFTISFPCGKSVRFSAFSEEDREEWTQKLSSASREVLHLQVDSVSEKILSTSSEESEKLSPRIDEQLSSAVFTNWTKRSFEFATEKQVCYCQERMSESKLSILLPLQLLKLYVADSESLCDQLESSLTFLPAHWNSVRFAVIRHISNNIDKYKRAANFLEGFSVNGPFFKQSIRKELDSFAFAPTNFHLQRFLVFEQETAESGAQWLSFDSLTSGACSAIPCKFVDGGAQKIRSKIIKLMNDQDSIDGCADSRFWARRAALEDMQKRVKSLRQEVAAIFGSDSNYDSSKVTAFLSRAKSLSSIMNEFIIGIPKLKEAFDCLSEFLAAESEKVPAQEEELPNGRIRRKSRLIPEAYEAQRSDILALDVSLMTKVSTLNELCHIESGSSNADFALWVKDACAVAMKLAEALAIFSRSVADALLFRLLVSLNSGGPSLLNMHYSLQFRRDVNLSQALSIVCTGILSQFWLADDAQIKKVSATCSEWPVVPLLLTVTSYLSCFSDEKGMLEDTIDVWHMIRALCHFRFVRTFSSFKSPSCIPVVEGNRSDITVNLPLPEKVFQELSQTIRAGERFKIFPIVWNVGINQEAMMARTFGDSALEKTLNTESLDDFRAYLTMKASVLERNSQNEGDSRLAHAEFLCSEIREILEKKSHSTEMNTKVLNFAAEATRALGGINLICCKSGKDRTGMAVTFEEGQILKETKGFSEPEILETLNKLRTDGTRRVNCSKNIGLAMYAFNSLQYKILPRNFRPPRGTYSSNQT